MVFTIVTVNMIKNTYIKYYLTFMALILYWGVFPIQLYGILSWKSYNTSNKLYVAHPAVTSLGMHKWRNCPCTSAVYIKCGVFRNHNSTRNKPLVMMLFLVFLVYRYLRNSIITYQLVPALRQPSKQNYFSGYNNHGLN